MSDEFVMSEEIEALAATLNDALENFYEPFDWHEATRISARILAAGYRKPRTITTVEELNALRVGSVVIDADEYVGRKERNSTRLPDWAVTLHKSSKDAHALTLPATVLWEPLP